MTENLEIEKKFLVKFPDCKSLNIKRKICILQTYLKNGKDNSQRRVRRIDENGVVKYVYTEKIFYSAITRKETEYEISIEEYNDLLAEKNLTACQLRSAVSALNIEIKCSSWIPTHFQTSWLLWSLN